MVPVEKSKTTHADGVLINGVNVQNFIHFFASLFPRRIDDTRCFPVLKQNDLDILWVKSLYRPNECESDTLFVWDVSGGLRPPLETELLGLYHSISTDRVNIDYWDGTRSSGKIIAEVYSGLPLTDIRVRSPATRPFFSILMPVYNRESTILRAVESMQKSTFSDFECIIIDDGSSDNTGKIIDSVIGADPRFVKLSNESNIGIGASLARGVLHSFGKWITRCDSDDEYMPEHLASRVSYIAGHDATVIYGGMVAVNGVGAIPLRSGAIVPVLQTAQGPTLFFRRDVLDRIGTFASIRYGEDEDFLNRAIECGEVVSKVSLDTYRYFRDTPDSLTSSYKVSRPTKLD